AVATDAGHLDVEAWRALAALEHDRGATADARDVLLKALSHIAEGPERLDLLEDLDTIYRDLHDGLARLRLLEEEIEPLLSDLMMDPRRVEILTQISTLREDSGDIDGALRSLEEASSIASENIVLLERRADIHELVGAWPAAHVVIEDALKAATQDADRARLSMRLGQILSQEGQEHPAITAYEHAIALGLDLPQEDLAWRRILDLHLRLGDPVAAAKAAEEAATQGETKARAQQIFQASQLWLKNAARPDEARRCLRQAVTLWPRHQRSLDSLESLAREDGDQQELIEVLRLKVEAAATHPPVQKALLVRLAETLATARSPEEARTAITHALNLDTNYLPALLFAARDNKSVKKSDAAQHYRHLIEALPSAPNITDTQRISILVEAHIFLAQDALEHEEEGHAEGHLEAALAAHPQQREALRALDALLIRQQRWTEALDAKHRLIPLVDDVEARGLAMAQVDILLTLDRVDDAVAHLERLIARDPQNEEALKRFDSLLREAGQRQRLLEAHEERAGRLQDQKSDSAPAWLAAADLARELGHEEQHRAYLQSAHAARPNDVQIVKALLTIIGSEDDELLVLLQRRLDLEGDAPEAANTLAKLIAATVSRGDSAGAIKALSATLTRPWVGAEEYTQCAELLVSEDRSNEAREIYATLRRRASHEEEKLRAC
ncbi:MAG: hypothetical protein KAI47_04100, partial [Deltaproteobacteria bacterium]|nr:hypothetical protein [Deltaproteobacteria bacterium]